jgi:hypothetical protein
LGANKDDWADIAGFKLVAIYRVDNAPGDLFGAIRHVHLEDLGSIKQAFYVLWKAENGGSLRGFIGSNALKYTHAVV